jgi:hypothetical protein
MESTFHIEHWSGTGTRNYCECLASIEQHSALGQACYTLNLQGCYTLNFPFYFTMPMPIASPIYIMSM